MLLEQNHSMQCLLNNSVTTQSDLSHITRDCAPFSYPKTVQSVLYRLESSEPQETHRRHKAPRSSLFVSEGSCYVSCSVSGNLIPFEMRSRTADSRPVQKSCRKQRLVVRSTRGMLLTWRKKPSRIFSPVETSDGPHHANNGIRFCYSIEDSKQKHTYSQTILHEL